VCFEVIEHVEDQELVLDELARVLREDGLLLISSPNRDRYVPGNPHHRHEFVRSELQAALDARFSAARIISQHAMLASVISWSDAPQFENVDTRRVAEPEPEDEIYLLGMAGSDLPPEAGPLVALGRFAEPRRWLDHIELQRRHIEEQASFIQDVEDREADRVAALERLLQAERELVELRAALERACISLAEREEQFTVLTTSKSWTMTEPLRRFAAVARRRR
jgi:SAM-dependent methyltransferase